MNNNYMVKQAIDDDSDATEIGARDANEAAEEFAKGECSDAPEIYGDYEDGVDVEVKDEDGERRVFTVFVEFNPYFSSVEKEQGNE